MTDARVEEKRLLLGDNDDNSYKSLGFPVNEEVSIRLYIFDLILLKNMYTVSPIF